MRHPHLLLTFSALLTSISSLLAQTPKENAPNEAAPEVSPFVQRLLNFDSNQDGKLTKDELPARMQTVLSKHDKNEDGLLDSQELQAMASQLGQPAGRSNSGRSNSGRSNSGRSNSGRSNSGRSNSGRSNSGRSAAGRRPSEQGTNDAAGPGSGLSPAQIVQEAMTFDIDKDGKLSREELLKFAEVFAQRTSRERPPEPQQTRPSRGRSGRGAAGSQRGSGPNPRSQPENRPGSSRSRQRPEAE